MTVADLKIAKRIQAESLWPQWNRGAATLVASSGTKSFSQDLMSTLQSVVRCDVPPLTLVFDVGAQPIAIHPPGASETEIREVNEYREGPYLLDPYYHLARAGTPSGAYRLRDIAPPGFRKSEFYRSYWRHTAIRDEIELLVQLPELCFVMVSLLRRKLPPFRRTDLRFLETISPLVAALVTQHWASGGSSQKSPRKRVNVESELSQFGADKLTGREQQIVQLLLRGHSTKSAAVKLSISPETVKLHRKHIYRKLKIVSQMDLFHVFIEFFTSQATNSAAAARR